jgi:hypothetical protein
MNGIFSDSEDDQPRGQEHVHLRDKDHTTQEDHGQVSASTFLFPSLSYTNEIFRQPPPPLMLPLEEEGPPPTPIQRRRTMHIEESKPGQMTIDGWMFLSLSSSLLLLISYVGWKYLLVGYLIGLNPHLYSIKKHDAHAKIFREYNIFRNRNILYCLTIFI